MASYLNYGTFLTTIANLMIVDSTDANYLQVLPALIADSEQYLYRELQLLDTVTVDTGGSLTANSRNFTLPQTVGLFVITNNINVFTPAGSQTSRIQMVPTTRGFLDNVWGNEASVSTPSVPQYYAMVTDQTIIVGPPPDAAYTMEVIGTIRPTPLSAANPTTYLTNVLPDLMISAGMIFASAYQQNFSAMSDNPAQSMSWKAHTDELLKSANTEENMKRYTSQAWTSQAPAPLATPPRV